MSTAIANFDNVDTATLEAALLGASTEPQPVAAADLEPAAAESTTPETGAQAVQPAGGEQAQTEAEQGSSPSTATDDAPPASADIENPAAVTEFSNLAEDEARALEIRKRNPDLSLEESLSRAREQLGLVQHPEQQGEPEPTLEDRIAAVESALDEAGANDGLFTTEIANLTKEHARLLAEHAVQRANQVRHDEVRTAEMREQRESSYQRAASMCPEALDSNSTIGQSLSAVIAEAEATQNPLLYDPQAPELFLALANARLPEAQRVELKRPAATTNPTPSEAQPAPAQPAKPSPAGVLPVAASARTAQPATRMIDPANLDRAIKEAPTDVLEAALLGDRTNNVLLRL
jgi:hypothetical protein